MNNVQLETQTVQTAYRSICLESLQECLGEGLADSKGRRQLGEGSKGLLYCPTVLG